MQTRDIVKTLETLNISYDDFGKVLGAKSAPHRFVMEKIEKQRFDGIDASIIYLLKAWISLLATKMNPDELAKAFDTLNYKGVSLREVFVTDLAQFQAAFLKYLTIFTEARDDDSIYPIFKSVR